ncbi:hypothetical protein ACFQ07_25345, partial [Actinomadura adrarensis]
GQLGATVVLAVLALLFGLLSWPLVRMAPRYSTRQEVAADGTGVTLAQEPKRWFPGRTTRIPWSQVRRISQDRLVTSGDNGRTVRYFVDIELREPLPGEGLPTWVLPSDGKIRIRSGKSKHEEIARALRTARPDLFTAD